VFRHAMPHFQLVELMKVHSVFSMAYRTIDVCTRRMLAVLKYNHRSVCYHNVIKYVPRFFTVCFCILKTTNVTHKKHTVPSNTTLYYFLNAACFGRNR